MPTDGGRHGAPRLLQDAQAPVSKVLDPRLPTTLLLCLLVAGIDLGRIPARLLVVKPLILGIPRGQDIEPQIAIHAGVVKVSIAPADEALGEKVAPELPTVLSVHSLAVPGTVVVGDGAGAG